MSLIGRILAALFGTLIFALFFPLSLWVATDGVPFDSFDELLWQVGIGAAIGAALGALFPKVFGFLFQAFMDVSSNSSGT